MTTSEEKIAELQLTTLKDTQHNFHDLLTAQASRADKPAQLDIRLDPYCGDGSDKVEFDDFCEAFEAASLGPKQPQKLMSEKLPGFPQLDALRPYNKLPLTKMADYKLAREALKLVLVPTSIRQTAAAKLSTLSQGKDQSGNDLARQLRQLG